ncbi:STAS domain-containing protein [Dactylosporangium sp. NPDC005555]|uniref:STAS domain-containing protein n=1 Tax=Dactylosporangium sp. NPDC005555 TaxID=3154889 RepID=UPI0033BC1783
MALSFEVQNEASGRVLIVLHGMLDSHGVAVFHRALAAALEWYPTLVGIDLTEVTLIDSAGVGALAAALRVGGRVGYRLVVAAISAAAHDRLRTSGLADSLDVAGRDRGSRHLPPHQRRP